MPRTNVTQAEKTYINEVVYAKKKYDEGVATGNEGLKTWARNHAKTYYSLLPSDITNYLQSVGYSTALAYYESLTVESADTIQLPPVVETIDGVPQPIAGIPLNWEEAKKRHNYYFGESSFKPIYKNTYQRAVANNWEYFWVGDVNKINARVYISMPYEKIIYIGDFGYKPLSGIGEGLVYQEKRISGKPAWLPHDDWVMVGRKCNYLGNPAFMIAAIGWHETHWGKLGWGKQGYYLGVGCYSSTNVNTAFKGLENQLDWAVPRLMNAMKTGYTYQNLLSFGKNVWKPGNPTAWANSIWSIYGSILPGSFQVIHELVEEEQPTSITGNAFITHDYSAGIRGIAKVTRGYATAFKEIYNRIGGK